MRESIPSWAGLQRLIIYLLCGSLSGVKALSCVGHFGVPDARYSCLPCRLFGILVEQLPSNFVVPMPPNVASTGYQQ